MAPRNVMRFCALHAGMMNRSNAKVRLLLASDEKAAGFLQQPAIEVAARVMARVLKTPLDAG